MATINRQAFEETYEDVRRLLYSICHKFCSKHGGDFYECMSEANLCYIDVYRTYDHTRGSFSTLLYTSVWRRLVNYSISRSKQQKELSVDVYSTPIPDRHHSSFSVESFLEYVSPDAALVVKLVVETPSEIMEIITAKGGEARNYHSTIRHHLSSIGWGPTRIRLVFDEIRLAMVSYA